MHRFAPTLLAAALLVAVSSAATAGDAARGRLLYETRCTGCHATSVHGRAKRTVAGCDALRAEVERWGRQSGPRWSADDVDDVALWLNERYYGFPVENGRCVSPVATLPRPHAGG